jgi:tripartite-type tricarboxylate transporter receptor subunit TctC
MNFQQVVFAQEKYPNRPIRIVVPTSPGASNDIIARLVAQGLSQRLGTQVVVDNRTGAGTIVGTDLVAKAPPDGYTLLMSVSTLAINPVSYAKMPYEVMRDFTTITQPVALTNLMVLHPSIPAKSVKEFIALVKTRPGQILYASAGYGTNPHLTIELFASMAQIRMIHVPYKGDGPGIVDLLGGHVAFAAASPAIAIPHVRAGRLRALGVTSERRVAVAPEFPTIAESGLPGFEAVQWNGLLAPADTPREIISRLHRETVAILRAPESHDRLMEAYAEVVGSSPEEFAAFIRAETAKWAKVAKVAGIKPE